MIGLAQKTSSLLAPPGENKKIIQFPKSTTAKELPALLFKKTSQKTEARPRIKTKSVKVLRKKKKKKIGTPNRTCRKKTLQGLVCRRYAYRIVNPAFKKKRKRKIVFRSLTYGGVLQRRTGRGRAARGPSPRTKPRSRRSQPAASPPRRHAGYAWNDSNAHGRPPPGARSMLTGIPGAPRGAGCSLHRLRL